MSSERCEWFKWIGGPVCDECGKPPRAHKGIEWRAPDAPIFTGPSLNIAWENYGPGKDLNVPMFTHYFGADHVQHGGSQ